MQEIWEPISEYEDRYEISNHGRVRALKSRVNIFKEPKILNPEIFKGSQTFYARVQLSNPRKRFLVHRLVGLHFVGNPDNKPQINHIDNNGLHNHHSNLEWTTQSENLKHAQKQGRLTEAQRKGGIVQSIKARENALTEATNLIGTSYSSWKVIANLGFHEVGTHGIERIRLMCECVCGVRYEVDKFYLQKTNGKTCKNCINNKVKI